MMTSIFTIIIRVHCIHKVPESTSDNQYKSPVWLTLYYSFWWQALLVPPRAVSDITAELYSDRGLVHLAWIRIAPYSCEWDNDHRHASLFHRGIQAICFKHIWEDCLTWNYHEQPYHGIILFQPYLSNTSCGSTISEKMNGWLHMHIFWASGLQSPVILPGYKLFQSISYHRTAAPRTCLGAVAMACEW